MNHHTSITFLHLTDCITEKEWGLTTLLSRSPQGAFCNPVPRHTCIFTMASWPLDFDLLAPGPVFLTLWSWVGAAEQDMHGWEDGSFMEEKHDLACPSRTVYSRAAITSHPPYLLKIAFTFHQQRQSRQDMARAFIFKYSLLPSKRSNWLGNILIKALQEKSIWPK